MNEGVDFAAMTGVPMVTKARIPWLRNRGNAGPIVALGLLLFAAIWLTDLAYTSLSPPTDNIEQLTWLRSLEWGYYKHPPLPTWLIWAPAQWLGINAWTSYVTGAAFTLSSMGLMWGLLVRLRGQAYAAVMLLAMLCITYYNGRLYYYNHNVVLMFFSTLSLLLCWKAGSTGRLRWWAALGFALGLGALSKYQVAVTMTSVLVFWLQQRGWRDERRRKGLLLATLIALLVFAPHLLWLRTHEFGPIAYAMRSSLGAHLGLATRAADAMHWLVDQLLNRALPAWLLIAATMLAMRRNSRPGVSPFAAAVGPGIRDSGRALLLIWGLVPLIFMPMVGILAGADLQLQWGTPFLLFSVPAAMELLGSRVDWRRASVRSALNAFVTLQVFLLALNYVTSPRGPAALRDGQSRAFDSAALATSLGEPVRQALGGETICVVSGPVGPAGALALQLPERPLVLIDGRFDQSPWVPIDRPKGCRMLELREGPSLPGYRPVGAKCPHLSWRIVD